MASVGQFLATPARWYAPRIKWRLTQNSCSRFITIFGVKIGHGRWMIARQIREILWVWTWDFATFHNVFWCCNSSSRLCPSSVLWAAQATQPRARAFSDQGRKSGPHWTFNPDVLKTFESWWHGGKFWNCSWKLMSNVSISFTYRTFQNVKCVLAFGLFSFEIPIFSSSAICWDSLGIWMPNFLHGAPMIEWCPVEHQNDIN